MNQDLRIASGHVLLDETRTEVNIQLNKRHIPNIAEAMDLAGLDDENVAGAGLEFLAIHSPESATLPHELNLVIRMTVRPGTLPRESIEEKYRDIDVAILGTDELVGAAYKGQIFLTDTVHLTRALTNELSVLFSVLQ
jgi:hypothetical protein